MRYRVTMHRWVPQWTAAEVDADSEEEAIRLAAEVAKARHEFDHEEPRPEEASPWSKVELIEVGPTPPSRSDRLPRAADLRCDESPRPLRLQLR